MERLKMQQEADAIAIIDAIKGYAEKYGENYLSFGYYKGAVTMNNDTSSKEKHYTFALFNDGKLIFHDAFKTYIRIRESGGK